MADEDFMALEPEEGEPAWPEGQKYEARVKSVRRICRCDDKFVAN